MATNGVVVWEWQNEYGQWRPYSPEICGFFESNKQATSPLQLGDVDRNLYLYTADLQKCIQTRIGTGTQRAMRRSIVPSTSPIAKGITWQWEGDVPGSWCHFDLEVAEYLDECFVKNPRVFIDLRSTKFRLPYHIDLANMTQTRIHTGRVRKLQRVFTSRNYPLDGPQVVTAVKRQSTSPGPSSSGQKRTRSSTTTSSVFGQNPNPVNMGTVPASSVTQLNSVIQSNSINNSQTSPFVSVSSSPNFQFGTTGTSAPFSFLPSLNSSVHHQGPITRRRHLLTQGLTFGQGNPQMMPQASSNSYPNPAGVNPFSQTHAATSQPSVSMPGGPLIGHGVPMFGHGQVGSSGQSGPVPGFPSMAMGYTRSGSLFGGSSSSRVQPNAASHGQRNAGYGSQFPPAGKILNYEKSTKQKSASAGMSAEKILKKYVTVVAAAPKDEDCCICYERLSEASGHGVGGPEDRVVLQLEKCSHMYHKLCLTALYDSGPKDGCIQCPACKTIYGEKTGSCPRGEMDYQVIPHSLAGHPDCKTIQIIYNIEPGVQGPEHPAPGQRYYLTAFPRIGYLPDNEKGRKVLQLLIVAWKRRLTFTIGRSHTTGRDHSVTWNEIHHKTELHGNHGEHGFPDPKYLDNLLAELAVHGVTESDLADSGPAD
ncbi:E3 ubiquitin-protein ligase DTX1-like [Mya arenaria]|uniref:E3 ubiquitin-protein ligase DTX1-like n=1 Tax=Mya arenaria TaxID=6604 RepID=UPI0022DE97D5|nr:E3 ubiquitin-protein ligase DTX1-like [Mya arenaria]